MVVETLPTTPREVPNFAPRLYSIALLVGVIILAGMWLVTRFTAMDLARDLQTWQEKLNLVAESRAADLNKWVNDQYGELQTLADNPSMQLYLSELQMLPDSESTGKAGAKQPESREPAQKSYLRNLLLFTAQRAGFVSQNSLSAIPANVQPESKSGLAVLNNENQLVVSTLFTPATRELMLKQAASQPAGQRQLIDLQKESDGTIYMGFIVPVFSIQGEKNASSQIGKLVAIRAIDTSWYSILKHPGITEKTFETILLRKNGDSVDYLSPLEDGAAPLSKTAEVNTKLAETALTETPGSFSNTLADYRKEVVLATSRQIEGTPWVMAVKIDRKEAFQASSQRRFDMMMMFFMIIAVIVLIIVAIWWHAYSQRAMMMSRHFKSLAMRAQAQEKLLRLVADNQPEAIYILDEHKAYRFANQKAAHGVSMSPTGLVGKSLNDVLGSSRAETIYEQCDKALGTSQTGYDVQRFTDKGKDIIIRSAYVPLEYIPIAGLPDNSSGVLVVEQDISEVVHEREQRLNTQRQLVQALVKLVDMRDPFAANHSLLVAQVAYEIAVEMELDYSTTETTRTAGQLMNIGKIVVPASMLTKTGVLSDEEKAVVRESMDTAAGLVKDIRFEGPVVETLRQWQEKWDGTGPMSMKGEDILLTARIIAVANAFVGMISPRAWRHAMSIEAANKFLLEQADSYFDRRVVIALINYVENHQGRAWLKQAIDDARNAA